jgi:hypothetical protein
MSLWFKNGKLIFGDDGLVFCDECPCEQSYLYKPCEFDISGGIESYVYEPCAFDISGGIESYLYNLCEFDLTEE